MISLPDSVLQTLAYSDFFSFPLTFQELHSRLIVRDCSPTQLRSVLAHLLRLRRLAKTGAYYHLPGRQALVAQRRRRRRFSRSLLSQARRLAARLGTTPGVLALYLTGAVAVNNATSKDDLDFLVVTRPGRLWLTRLYLTLRAEFMGRRRRPHDRVGNGQLCFNLYLTPFSFSLPPAKRSLYTAYELIQTLPLYDPYHTHSSLLAANPWIQSYLPNFPLPPNHFSPSRAPHSFCATFCENLAYRFQRFYMKPKLTREYITPHSAFFHPRNLDKKILSHLNLSVKAKSIK